MKQNFKKNIIFGILLLFMGIAIGIGITHYLPLLAGNKSIKMVDEMEAKKQALAKFYNEISVATDKQDWGKIYDLSPQSLRNNVTKKQYILYETALKDRPIYKSTTIHSIKVVGNNGTVERTLIICVTKECTGDNRKEDTAKREYIYIDGKWQRPDPEPSDRALKAASYLYVNMSESEQKKLQADFGYGVDSASFVIREYALFLDGGSDKLALLEAWIDKNKAESNRPVVNYQPPAVIQQSVQQSNDPVHCTSNTVGNFAYTDCY